MAVRPGTPNPSAWWEADEFLRIRQQVAEYRKKGDLVGWESEYQYGYYEARRQGIVAAQIAYLSALGSVRMLRFHYPEALEAYLASRKLAESTGDWLDAGGVDVNLTSLYAQVWDLPSALAAAEAGRAAVARVPAAYYKPQLLLLLADLKAGEHDPGALALFQAGIEAARGQYGISPGPQGQAARRDAATEAQGWDHLGSFLLNQGRLEEAEPAIVEAFFLRKLHVSEDLPQSYASLGALKLAQALATPDSRSADLDGAEKFTARAIAAAARGAGSIPLHLLLHQRGRILQERGRMAAALDQYAAAVDAATHWRRSVLAAGSALTGSNVELDRRVFDTFVETAAAEAIRTGSGERASESFLAAEMNRAASLREAQALAPIWRQKLPAVYWETLSKLRALQARSLGNIGSGNSLEKRLQLEITEMEAVAGLGVFSNVPENFRSENSLIQFRAKLRDDEVLLSFHLGRQASYLWAVTGKSLRIFRLDAGERVRSRVAEFREAVAAHRPEAAQAGQKLYASLFGQLEPEQLSKKSWLLSLEDSLFDAPFAALVANSSEAPAADLSRKIGGKLMYLIEKHSIQVIPGAFSLEASAARSSGGRMVAVGDPIYNAADPRWMAAMSRPPPLWKKSWKKSWWISLLDPGFALNRLPASGAEIEASARAWGDATVLEGGAATRAAFLAAVSDPPAVIHLATHVLTEAGRRDQALVAFGLDREGQPEMLSIPEVASLSVPGSLVVMTGCSTGTSESAAGVGLLGLSRAWMAAGATGVVATGWPVKDSSGPLLAGFYQRLKHFGAAEALRQAQMEMLYSGTWQASPAYWAAYQLSGGAR